MEQTPFRGALLGLVAFAAYACCDVMLKFLGQDMSSFQVVLVAGLFALPFLLAKAIWTNGLSFVPVMPGWTLLRVAITSVNVVLVIYTFTHLPLAQCYAIFFSMPLLITLFAWPLLGEPIDATRGAFVALGFIGVLIAVQPGREPLQVGHLTALAGATLGALNSLILRKIGGVEKQGVLLIYPVLGQLALAAVLTLTYEWQPLTGRAYVAATVLGVLSTVGSVVIIMAYRIAPAIAVAPMQYSQIIWASGLGYILFREVPSPSAILGIAVISFAGVILLWLASRPRPIVVAPTVAPVVRPPR